ncbi:prolipoprotein diacylglyceryl transferase [compost metagenome]
MSYFIWYSIGRFFIERVRTDSLAFKGPDWLASFLDALWAPMKAMGFEPGALDPQYGNIRISQLLAILIIVAAIILIIYRRKTGLSSARYSDPIISTKAPAEDHLPEAPTVPELETRSESFTPDRRISSNLDRETEDRIKTEDKKE